MTSPVTDSPPPVSVPEMTKRDASILKWYVMGVADDCPDFTYAERDAMLKNVVAIAELLASGDYKLIRTEEIVWARDYLEGLKADAVQKLGTTVLYDITGKMSGWLATTEGAK